MLEILVGLGLVTILLSLLFSIVIKNLYIEKKMELIRHTVTERQYVQVRIQDLLTSLKMKGPASGLYTEVFPKESFPSVLFITDQGVDPDPRFSGTVLARLYVDEKKNLCIALWPDDKNQKNVWRKEILLQKVGKLRLEFLKGRSWVSSWPKEETPPSMLRISIEQEGETLKFAFVIPSVALIPTYEGSIL